MSALPIIITTAGLNALVNAQNTGASNVVIASLGVSPTQITATAATAAIPGEVKRIAGVAGQVVADDQIYISAADQTDDTYTVRTIGLYLNTGVLFGVYSQGAPLLEKAAPAMAVLEAAIKLSAPQANAITFAGGGWLNPQASETVQGVLKLAPVAEAVLGADHSKAVTPKGLKAATSAMMAAIQATFDQIAQSLAGKANIAHEHAAGDVTSGTFSEARIPALGMEKITGLANALAAKAAAIHGHVMSNIDGLVEALNAKASLGANVYFALLRIGTGRALLYSDANTNNLLVRTGAEGVEKFFQFGDDGALRALSGPVHSSAGRVWDPENFNPATKATLGESVTFADVRAFRGNGTGVVYLGDLSHYLFFDGVNYNLPGAALIVNGGVVWTSATFDPATKANASNPVFTGPMRHTGSSVEMPGNGSFFAMNLYYDGGWRRRSADHGWALRHSGGILDILYGPSGAAGQVVAERNIFRLDAEQGRLVIADGIVWTHLTFNPASKVDVFNPDGYSHAISLGWNGSRMVARVDNAAAAPGQALVHLNDAASASAASAGLATDQFVTPAALWSFARNMGSPGYAVIPGTGLMFQWGLTTANIPEGETHAYLPVAFGGGCLIALANARNVSRNINTDYYMQVSGHFIDRIAFFANRANGSAGNLDGYEWLAIGRVSGTPDPAYSSGSGGGTGGGGSGSGGGSGGGSDQQQI